MGTSTYSLHFLVPSKLESRSNVLGSLVTKLLRGTSYMSEISTCKTCNRHTRANPKMMTSKKDLKSYQPVIDYCQAGSACTIRTKIATIAWLGA